MVHLKEFYHHYYHRTLKKKVQVISPFSGYINWEEEKIEADLKDEIGWKKSDDVSGSTWKADCYIATIKLYLFRQIIGYNDVDDHLSWLIREGQITREEALGRLSSKNDLSEDAIGEICERIGIDYSILKKAIAKAKLKYGE